MKSFPFPIKLSIPAILLVFGSIFSFFSLQLEIYLSNLQVEENMNHEAAYTGSEISGILEYLYRDGEGKGADLIIDHIATEPDIQLALLIDENNQVLEATRFEFKGKYISNTPVASYLSIIKAVGQVKIAKTLLSADKKSLLAVYPVGLKFLPGGVSVAKLGTLLIKYDLTSFKAKAYQDAQGRAIASITALALLCAILWLFFTYTLQKRVAKLVTVSNSLATGNLDARANLQGSDELVQISHAFDQMAAEIQNNIQMIRSTQAQLIQAEKMSSLGQLVAGIAHEVNNPVSFIHGNIEYAKEYIEEILEILKLYQNEYPQATPKIEDKLAEIELEFLEADLKKLLSSMQVGTKRIKEIVLSLRNFSRLDEAELKSVDLHEGIDNTLIFLDSQLKANSTSMEIAVIKEYGNLPLVKCYPGQLNQVFMNILVNAIDVLEQPEFLKKTTNQPTIHIHTEKLDSGRVLIRIADNGPGISESVRSKIFDPFFTTKPIGKGTGLGLSISYQIVDKHQGTLRCVSDIGKGTEFQIEIPV